MTFHFKNGVRNRYFFLVDLVFIVVSVFGAYVLRLEAGYLFKRYLPSAYWMIGISILIKPVIYYFFGLYRRLWIYASVSELKVILIAVTGASALVSMAMIIFATLNVFIGFPRSALVIDWILSVVAVGGVRFGVRALADSENRKTNALNLERRKRALVVGAGDAGAMVVREVKKNPQLNVETVGFIDDDPQKLNQTIHGIKVMGSIEQLGSLIQEDKISDVVFAIPSAPGRILRVVSDTCHENNVSFQTMPGIYELLGGRISINKLREVEITDLLRRDPVKLDTDNIGAILKNKVVLVTGAGGSIGRELCNQIARWNPKKIVLLGHGENSIFESLMDLRDNHPELKVSAQIADIRDITRIGEIFRRFKPQIVFHAAAHKHVPLMENNVEEAVTNNVIGTRNLVRIANQNGVERFVMISTDKAVRPINIMGATKRIAENVVLNESKKSNAEFTVVRFGNVLGSRGSVVPIFKKQIARGGPVTITDPEMKRYFMTIPEAVYLVLEAAGFAEKQETFVLNMGKQIRILDLAEDLIRLSGLKSGQDIEIRFTGMRKGEKLSEDLWNEGQILAPTPHPDIFKLNREDLLDSQELDRIIDQLLSLARAGSFIDIRQFLNTVIPDAQLSEDPEAEIFSI